MKTGNVYADRLIELADYMDALPEQSFNYAKYVGYGWKGMGNPIECRTTACALGASCLIPNLAAAGLELRLAQIGNTNFGYVALKDAIIETEDDVFDAPAAAAKKVFDLDAAAFEYCFIPVDQHDGFIEADGTDYFFGNVQNDYDGNPYALKYEKNSPRGNCSPKDIAQHLRFFVYKKYNNFF
jgi:hypothetical protein